METDSWITCLQKNDAIKSVINIGHVHFYLIGSSIHKKTVKDIDIAIIYMPSSHSTSTLIKLRLDLFNTIFNEFGMIADILLLSYAEAEEVDFFSKEALKIK